MTASQTGTLHVVATPLGNLKDITLRALEVLAAVDLVACEDTRRTARLLAAHGIRARTVSCYEHNERQRIDPVLDALRAGKDVALVSDAGTPAISDPGFRLVRAAREAGLPVVPIPGASAATAALSVSGLPSDRFLFVGFLPSRARARRTALAELADQRATLVIYESPHRVGASLADMLEAFGDREAFVCREATKRFEEYRRGRLAELAVTFGSAARGEFVIVIAGAADHAAVAAASGPEEAASVESLFERLVGEGRTRREAVKEVARRCGLSPREVYARTLNRS